MNKWLYPAVLIVGLIFGLAGGFVLSNVFVVKPLSASYGKQIDHKDELIAKLAETPKNLIQNSLTVKKVKKGSSVYYIPSSDLQAIEVKIDSLVRDFTFPDDSADIPGKTFWERIKFW